MSDDRRVTYRIWIEEQQDDHVIAWRWDAQPTAHVTAFLLNEIMEGRMRLTPDDWGFCVRSELIEEVVP